MFTTIPNRKRVCGDCTACCTTHGVKEIKKDPFTDCRFCTGQGCQIYAKRPKSCRKFDCEWLKGYGEEIHRPDKIGLVLDYLARGGELCPVVMIFEYRPDALKTGADFVWKIIKSMTNRQISVGLIHRNGQRQLFFPPGKTVTPVMTDTAKFLKMEIRDLPIVVL